MQEINSAKIQFAAHFIANQLDIYFLESSHGEHSKLFIVKVPVGSSPLSSHVKPPSMEEYNIDQTLT